jgi:hypothetical protein
VTSLSRQLGEQSPKPRRGEWEFSSTVALSTQCVGINTVDCRDRSFGLSRLIRSDSAQLNYLSGCVTSPATQAEPLAPNRPQFENEA